MKILLVITLVLALTQALPIQDELRLRILDLVWQKGIPRPFASFHPTTINNKRQDVKDHWKEFEWKGFGPSIKRRPFSFMDFRIIGK